MLRAARDSGAEDGRLPRSVGAEMEGRMYVLVASMSFSTSRTDMAEGAGAWDIIYGDEPADRNVRDVCISLRMHARDRVVLS